MIERDPHIRQTAFVPICELRRQDPVDEIDGGNLWLVGCDCDDEVYGPEIYANLAS